MSQNLQELNRVYLDEFVERNKKEQARAIDVQASVALANAKRLFGKQMQDLFADNKESDASELSSRILMLKTQVHDEAQEALAGTSFMPQLNEVYVHPKLSYYINILII